MYHNLIEVYWWDGVKRDIAEFVPKCQNCQQVKVEHIKPCGLTQIMDVPIWKWEAINLDFVVGLSRTQKQNDSIKVSVDWLTKSAHFIPVMSTYTTQDYARIYINEIVSLHGIPLSIIFVRGAQFTSVFGSLLKRV